MMKDKILVYGASGYVGKLFAEQVRTEGLPIVLSARKPFAADFPVRIFSLNDRDEILKNIADVKLLINLAGPFASTNCALIEACIKNGSHYIDIAGEASELATAYQYNNSAKNAGIMLMPGAGFGVAPTDIAAHLAKEKLPDATHLIIAYITIGNASRGTLKTVLTNINKEGVLLRNGIYEKAMPAFRQFVFATKNKKHKLVYNPWRGDLFSAKMSTGIQNIQTYSNFPGFVVQMMQGKMLWLRDLILKRFIKFLPEGPSHKQLKKGKTICYAEVTNQQNNKAMSTITGPEAYLFTAQILLAITQRIMRDDFAAGYQTPSLYGRELMYEIEGVTIE